MRGGAWRWIGSGAVLCLLMPPPALAGGDAPNGRALAARWCASCHQVEPDSPSNGIALSFQMLASQNRYETEWQRTWLADPHPPIKGIIFSRQQIDDVVAYLDAITTEPSPLLTPSP